MTAYDRTGRVGELGIKAPVRAATTAAITLSGEQTIDGVAIVTGDRVLVKDQASSIANGIYVCDTGTWSRANDWDGSYDAANGTLIKVNSGTANSGFWYASGTDPIEVGTDAVTFIMASTVLAVISAFAQTLLDDTTAAAARTTLGSTTVGDAVFVAATAAAARSAMSAAGSGAVTASGLTMTTARLLGRTTASTGAVEEITAGAGLTLSAGSLTAAVAATQAEMEADSSTAAWASPGRMKYHPGVAKAWAANNAATMQDVYNVTSITNNGTGDYTYNFTNSLNNATYAAIITGNADRATPSTYTRATGSFRIAWIRTSDSTAQAPSGSGIAIFGDFA